MVAAAVASSQLPTAAAGAAPMSAAAAGLTSAMDASDRTSSAASHTSVFLVGSPPDSPHRPAPVVLAAAKQPGYYGRPVTSSNSGSSSSGGSSGSGSGGSSSSRGRRAAAAAGSSSSAPAKPKTGYRKLWALVSSVERGQHVAHRPKHEEVTVEDLIRAVSKLPPTGATSAFDAVTPGLAFLDSRAAAALLKGLAKAGMPQRAVEIFDHLRSLPSSDDLSALCDVYTYTTMISQCNSHHQLRRALELVAEMRSRDVPLNVHTYSALLNVCLKADELELAQDVHARMLAEGVAPNLVTYHTLLDLHSKAGLWRDALGVLDLLHHQNIRPEARTFNTIITTCNAAGCFTEAVRVYEAMVAAGVEPNGASYNAALTSYARSGGDTALDTVLALFAAMGARGYERGTNTYAAVLAATEQPGRWDIALRLLQQMQGEGVRPSAGCLTSAMTACLHAGEPLRAEEVFNRLCGVCKPDAATFSTLVIVFTSQGKVPEAVNMLEILLRSGQHIEPATLSAVIDAAWGTGVVPLQQYAQQLLERGQQQGLFTVTQQASSEGCVLDLQLPGSPAHVVQLSLLALLAQLRDQAGTLLSPTVKEGSGCSGKVLLRLPAQGQDASALRHLVNTQLSALASPFGSIPPVLPAAPATAGSGGGDTSPAPAPDDASAASELRFAADAAAVGEWLTQSPAVALALGQLVGPAASSQPASGFFAAARGGVDGLVVSADDVQRDAKCRQAMASVAAFDSLAVSAKAIPPAMLPQRCELAAVLLQHAALLGLPSEVGHDAVQLLDRLLASPTGSLATLAASASPALLVAACLTIAARHDPTAAAAAADAAALCGVQPQQVQVVVGQVQQLLGSRGCIAISAMRVLQLMLERLGVADSRADGAAAMAVCGQAVALLMRAAVSPAFVGCVPAVMAAAVLYASRLAAGLLPAWPAALAGLTSFAETDAALQPAIQAAMQLLVEL